MRERAARIGAEVVITSGRGEGTTVTLTLPPHPVAMGKPMIQETPVAADPQLPNPIPS